MKKLNLKFHALCHICQNENKCSSIKLLSRFVDLLIIIELIKEVALAFTTGTGDLAGNIGSKVGIFT